MRVRVIFVQKCETWSGKNCMEKWAGKLRNPNF